MERFQIGDLLQIADYQYPVRLSHIFKRYDNALVGLTSVWPVLSAKSMKSVSLVGSNQRVGWAEAPTWNSVGFEYSNAEEVSDESRTSGILTTTFELSSACDVSLDFACDGKQIVSFFEAMGIEAFVGGKSVGQIGHYSDDITVRIASTEIKAFPLLRLMRSDNELADPSQKVRNGALVTDARGNLVGVIINLFLDDKAYSIAPIEEILSYHSLLLPRLADITNWNTERRMLAAITEEAEHPRSEQSEWAIPVESLDERSQQRRIYALTGGVGNAYP